MTGQHGPYNVAFYYLPFVLDGAGDAAQAYKQAKEAFRSSSSWHEVDDDIRYLFRYICEKYDPKSANCQCHHFVLNDEALEELGLGKEHAWVPVSSWARKQKRWRDSAETSQIIIEQVHCYVFSTSVNILMLRMRMVAVDAYAVAERLFYLKNVRNAVIMPYDTPAEDDTATPQQMPAPRRVPLMGMVTSLVDLFAPPVTPHFFFYANEGRERANTFLHVEAPEDAPGELDADRVLYYLANVYKQDFDYDAEHVLPVRSYWATPATLWGSSAEALACLTLPARAGRGKGFLTSVFKRNVQNEYQFLYLLLLHQKYAYYRLLMSIGAGQRSNRAQLEQFHRELEVFKANFVFSRVSETQQYQVLYDMVADELRLADMERDVAEPIAALAQLRQEDEERAKLESDRQVEHTMNMVALLAGISAITDALDLINNYMAGNLPQVVRSALSLVVTVALMVVTIRAARDLMKADKD